MLLFMINSGFWFIILYLEYQAIKREIAMKYENKTMLIYIYIYMYIYRKS